RNASASAESPHCVFSSEVPDVRDPTPSRIDPPPMQQDASHERVSRLTGIALMCGAVACFAMLDTTAKYLNLYMSTLQVVWARYTGAFLFPFIASNPWTRPGLTRTNRPAPQIGRWVLLLASTLCNFRALRYLQLAEAIALVFSTPFFVAALSGPMLGEWCTGAAGPRSRWASSACWW